MRTGDMSRADLEARLKSEVAAMCGDDLDAPELTNEEWAKVVTKGNGDASFGDKVKVIWKGQLRGIVDHGYLTRLPGDDDDWDMCGVVHVPHMDGDDGPSDGGGWAALYALCRNADVKRIEIGSN